MALGSSPRSVFKSERWESEPCHVLGRPPSGFGLTSPPLVVNPMRILYRPICVCIQGNTTVDAHALAVATARSRSPGAQRLGRPGAQRLGSRLRRRAQRAAAACRRGAPAASSGRSVASPAGALPRLQREGDTLRGGGVEASPRHISCWRGVRGAGLSARGRPNCRSEGPPAI